MTQNSEHYPYDRNEFGLAFSVPESADISLRLL